MTHYTFKIESVSPLRVRSSTGVTNLGGPVAKATSKVYVISVGADIVYVGSTKQRIRSRLYGALNVSVGKGYQGYAWRNSTEALQLFPTPCFEWETIQRTIHILCAARPRV